MRIVAEVWEFPNTAINAECYKLDLVSFTTT